MLVNIKKRLQLDDTELAALRQLYEESETIDGYKTKNYWNIVANRQAIVPCDILYYDDETLIAYTGVFNFTPDETEFCCLVHPDYRRRGIFNELLQKARDIVKIWEIKTVLLPCAQEAEVGKTVLKKINTTYVHSEISMQLMLPWQEHQKHSGVNIELITAKEQDIMALALLDEACFHSEYDEMVSRYLSSVHEPNRHVWLAAISDDVIGKIHVRFDEGIAYIHDFCVIPQCQGKGYGTDVLIDTITFLLNNGYSQICLDVVYSNIHAIKLYERIGFKTTAAFDFYRLVL